MRNAIINFFLFVALICSIHAQREKAYSGYHATVGIPKAEYLRTLEQSEGIVSRIIGGSQAALGKLYYQTGLLITLTNGGTSICGGSLVSTTRVLTAAHCWWDGQMRGKQLTVVLGSLKIFSGGTRVQSSDVTIHRSWNPNDITNDVAMVKMAAIKFTNNINAIKLPVASDANNDFSGLMGTASGYGKTSDGQAISPNTATLYHRDLSIIKNVVCQRSFEMPIQNSHLCTSGDRGVGTCDGDSGGPLAVNRNRDQVLVGIASFGLGDGCQRGYPSVFTRVTAYLTWIRANM